MSYEILICKQTPGNEIIENVECRTKVKAIKKARELCFEFPAMQVWVEYYSSKGEECFLNDDGKHAIVGRDWNRYSN